MIRDIKLVLAWVIVGTALSSVLGGFLFLLYAIMNTALLWVIAVVAALAWALRHLAMLD